MKKRKTATALLLVLALCLALCGCGGRRAISYKVIAELNKEEFCIAFRNDDPLCEIITAALREVEGIGEAKAGKYGGDVLGLVAAAAGDAAAGAGKEDKTA